MRYLLEGDQAKNLDRYTIETFGMQSLILMERAAYEVAACIRGWSQNRRRVFVMAGTGNNGADGLAAARILCQWGYQVEVLVVGKTEKATSEWVYQKMLLDRLPVICHTGEEAVNIPGDCDCYVDALFGIGLKREITGNYREVISRFMEAAGSSGEHLTVAVDISSGICAKTGAVYGIAVKADITVSFGYGKTGQILYPGAAYTGELRVVDIGLDEEGLKHINEPVRMMEKQDAKRMLPIRDSGGNKGSFGTVLVVAGAAGMAGAACFAAEAAYRTGAGLVRVFTDPVNHMVLQTRLPEAVLLQHSADTILLPEAAMQRVKAIVVGPGLSVSAEAEQILDQILNLGSDVPVVIDADGLNLLARKGLFCLGKNVVLTPHLGEMSRLLGCSIAAIRENGLIESARMLHKRTGAIVVCKDARTVICCGEEQIYINATGNDGMATGGSGDVLSGMIAGLIAQGADPSNAAILGAYLHGIAGDKAAEQIGRNGMLATDILRMIPQAVRSVQGYVDNGK